MERYQNPTQASDELKWDPKKGRYLGTLSENYQNDGQPLMGPQQKIVKDVRLNPIKTCEDLRWDPKKETIKYARWNPVRTLSKRLTTISGTPRENGKGC